MEKKSNQDKKRNKTWWKYGIRLGMLAISIAILLVAMPKADHQSYSFELNQPWKYPLLTAEFDMPVLRDTATANKMRDSINVNFIPFVKRMEGVADKNDRLLADALADSVSSEDLSILRNLLRDAYNRGILEEGLSETVRRNNSNFVRTTDRSDSTLIHTEDASRMLTAGDAYDFIDSAFNSAKNLERGAFTPYMARTLYSAIEGNILLDTVTDEKFRNQELLDVTAAIGVIKQGQRIIDRGDIIDSQAYTNLTTYLQMLDEMEEADLSQTYYTIGQGIIILMILLCLYFYLWHYQRDFFDSMRQMVFLMSFITLFVIFAIVMFEYVPNGLSMVPFAMVPVVVMTFFESRTSIVALIMTVLICSLFATYPLQFIIRELLAGIFAALSITQLTRRWQLLQTAAITFIVYSIAYVGMLLVSNGNLDHLNYRMFGYYFINAVILSFAYILIVLIEKIFGFTSNVTLVELSDINNQLLRRLAEEAPGTFQHSVQVSTLAAEAARAIGANTLLVRTGALYHDIGKLDSPVFFTENQHGVNPHSGLDPETSAKKIISHISSGIALAKENRLPDVIKDFIRQHHGKGVARYFYTTACNDRGAENVDRGKFEYPGPDPLTQETAILMMADAVEAASRSLKDYSQESITNLVNRIIDGQLADGMFKEAPVTLRDIETIKKTFIKRLGTIYHTRTAYPEMNKN